MADDTARLFLPCAAGCKRLGEILRDPDGSLIYPPGWSQLQMAADRWRCPTCERELRAAASFVGTASTSGDTLPPNSRGALPRETASTITPPTLKG